MSFSFCPFYKLLLNDDIKSRILRKIESIKSNSDWCDFDLHIRPEDLHLSTLNCDAIKQQRNIWRSIAKLSIDLWIDFEYYQQFTFESQYECKEYKERLEDLGYAFSDNKWKIATRPSDEVVQTNVFIYCLHQLIYKEMKDNVIICAFCDEKIKNDQYECHCGASFDEIKNIRQKLLETLNDELCIGGSLNVQHSGCCSKNNKQQKITHREAIGVSFRKSTVKEEVCEMLELTKEVRKSMWKCGGCGFYNGYMLLNCQACEKWYREGYWTCGSCTMENRCVNEVCGTCGERNTNVQVVKIVDSASEPGCSKSLVGNEEGQCQSDGGDVKKVELLREDQWQCSKCGLRQTYDRGTCASCEDNRSLYCQWTCSKCTLLNKSPCDMCKLCNSINKYIIMKYCPHCKVNRLMSDDSERDCCNDCSDNDRYRKGRWQCWYDNCRELNSAADEYCKRCKLWRHNSQRRGERSAQWWQGKQRYVWVCHRCFTVNEPTRLTCARFFCRETRYKKSYCFRCDVLGDGTANYCLRCSMRLC